MSEDQSDEHGLLIEVNENKHLFYKSRLFRFGFADVTRSTGLKLRVAAEAVINPPLEVDLGRSASQYDDLHCGALRRIMRTKNGSGGTAFPVTPQFGGAALWMTCQHVQIGLGGSGSLSTALDVRLEENVYWNSDLGFYDVPDGAVDMPKPSDPAGMLQGTFTAAADLAIFRVDPYAQLAQYTKFFVPSAHMLEHGAPLTCLGYPGQPSVDYAAKHFWSNKDYDMHVRGCKSAGREPDSKETFQLNPRAARDRLLDLCDSDGAFTAEWLSAAPGAVHAATDKVIEHTCSTLPQMSGAPCVLMHTPYKLAGIHLQGGGSGARNYNYAVSVKHPLLVKSYVEFVLPELTNMPTSIFAFAPDALSTVHEYLDTQKDCIARNGLVHLVAKFKAAHPLQ